MTSPRDYLAKILNSTSENLEDVLPPEHFDTPIPPRPKPRLNRKRLIKKMFNRKLSAITTKTAKPSSSEERSPRFHLDDPTVTFQDKVEAISVGENSLRSSSESSDYDYYDDDKDDEAEEDGDISTNEIEIFPESLSVENVNCCSESGEKSISSITDLLKSFIFVDVGPNITDTVNEFTNLLADVATRKIHAPAKATPGKE